MFFNPFYLSALPLHISIYLQNTDLFLLRWVWMPILVFASDFIRNNFKSPFKKLAIPTSHFTTTSIQTCRPTQFAICLNDSSSTLLSPDIPTLLNLYGNQITSLKINHFAALSSEHELNFYSKLPILLHLDISFLDATKLKCKYTCIKL